TFRLLCSSSASAPATRWRRNTAASCTRYCINPLLPDGALIWPTCRPQAG
ncbi:hypothetical protein LTSEWAN_0874, partial [Salmonella enterica subsp. enterica serovar Wandsworth str. A4-580]